MTSSSPMRRTEEMEIFESILTKTGSLVELLDCRCLGKTEKHRTRPISVHFKNVRDKLVCFSEEKEIGCTFLKKVL